MIIGYARVSIQDQNLKLQRNALQLQVGFKERVNGQELLTYMESAAFTSMTSRRAFSIQVWVRSTTQRFERTMKPFSSGGCVKGAF